ncbi:MAG: hypothetical protein RIQ94_973, partial [Pseudomonadota bacterium]
MTDLLGNKPLRQMIPAILLTGLLILSFMVISDLLISLIWAVIIAYIMWPPYQWLKFKLKNKANLSAALMSIIIATIISLITFWLITLLQDESKSAYQSLAINFSQEPHQLPSFIIKIPWLGAYLQECLDRLIDDRTELISQLGDWAKQWLGGLAKFIGDVGQNAIKFGVILVTVFFCFRDGKEIIQQLQQGLVQYLGKYQHVYLNAAGNTTRAVVYGLVLAALGQGLLAGVGYSIAGVKAPVLFGALTALLALIPMGATLVWLPTGITLILMDQLWPGLGLLLWGFLVVSTVDNVIRPLVISGASRVPFLVVLFGVLGGLKTFGAVGLFLGPVILAVLLSVWQSWLKLQKEEYSPELRKQQIWHALSINQVIKCLASNHAEGLTQIIAAERLIRYG